MQFVFFSTMYYQSLLDPLFIQHVTMVLSKSLRIVFTPSWFVSIETSLSKSSLGYFCKFVTKKMQNLLLLKIFSDYWSSPSTGRS